jgi:hypothetical protein
VAKAACLKVRSNLVSSSFGILVGELNSGGCNAQLTEPIVVVTNVGFL